jgi:hypothetical protein
VAHAARGGPRDRVLQEPGTPSYSNRVSTHSCWVVSHDWWWVGGGFGTQHKGIPGTTHASAASSHSGALDRWGTNPRAAAEVPPNAATANHTRVRTVRVRGAVGSP